jgi:hypothetical protein
MVLSNRFGVYMGLEWARYNPTHPVDFAAPPDKE